MEQFFVSQGMGVEQAKFAAEQFAEQQKMQQRMALITAGSQVAATAAGG